MTDDTAARLRALAQAAPKGPWTLLGAPDDAAPHLWTIVTADGLWTAREPVAEFHKLRPEARALQASAGRYIAAASPDVLLSLLDALDEARRERDEWRNKHDAHVREANGWHRRMQQAEAACAAAYEGKPRSGGKSVGRSLANMAAMHYRGERDAAVALLRVAKVELENAWRREEWAPDSTADALNRIDALLGDGAGGA